MVRAGAEVQGGGPGLGAQSHTTSGGIPHLLQPWPPQRCPRLPGACWHTPSILLHPHSVEHVVWARVTGTSACDPVAAPREEGFGGQSRGCVCQRTRLTPTAGRSGHPLPPWPPLAPGFCHGPRPPEARLTALAPVAHGRDFGAARAPPASLSLGQAHSCPLGHAPSRKPKPAGLPGVHRPPRATGVSGKHVGLVCPNDCYQGNTHTRGCYNSSRSHPSVCHCPFLLLGAVCPCVPDTHR